MNAVTALLRGKRGLRTRRYERNMDRIEAAGRSLRTHSDEALRQQAANLRARVQAGEDTDAVLVPAFSLCREAAQRVLGMRHYDVQMIGGMALHDGLMAEMKTGALED